MAVPSILKKKSLYIVLALVLVGGIYFWQKQKSGQAVTYETAEVVRGKLVQTVEVTGEIKPAARIDLAFKSNGTLEKVGVKIGDEVKKGQVMAELEDDDLGFAYQRAKASVQIAQANLNARLAGESDESIRMARAQLEQAKAAYDKAVSDLEITKIQVQNDLSSAKVALETAKNNYDNNVPVTDQSLTNAAETARTSLKAAIGPLNTALGDGDTISGVDDNITNQMYEQYLGVLSNGSMEKARTLYLAAKTAKDAAEKQILELTAQSSRDQIQSATDKTQAAIENVQTYLLEIKNVLAYTMASSYFTTNDITNKRAVIDADYNSVSGQKTGVVQVRQALALAELSNTSDRAKLEDALKAAQIQYEIAQTNISMKTTAAESNVAIQKAAVDSAQAALDLKAAGPREVDVAALRAQLQDMQVALAMAENNLNNVRVIAPVDGTVTDVVSDIGEQVTANTPQVKMIGTSQYDIEAKVPEADISKIKIGQIAEITLDAYGDEVKFAGTVTAINPDQTKVQDAIYYNIRVTIDQAGRDIKPGMTSNVIVTTGVAEDTLIIPLRAVKTENGKKTVRFLVNGQPQTTEVVLGLKGDEGKIQVISGLKPGEQVVLSEKKGQ